MGREVNVMTTTDRPTVTLEEFRALPQGPPFYEFEEGELILVTSPTLRHQDILAELDHIVRRLARERNLGRVGMEVDVHLPDGRVYIPDLTFLSIGRLDLLDSRDGKIHGSPDLVVEITSSDPERDRVHKFRVYYENGVPWYWIVDGETLAIEEYHATPDGYLRTASVAGGEEFRPRFFAGLSINLAALIDVTP
jgi:Uma2 family endonuclease